MKKHLKILILIYFLSNTHMFLKANDFLAPLSFVFKNSVEFTLSKIIKNFSERRTFFTKYFNNYISETLKYEKFLLKNYLNINKLNSSFQATSEELESFLGKNFRSECILYMYQNKYIIIKGINKAILLYKDPLKPGTLVTIRSSALYNKELFNKINAWETGFWKKAINFYFSKYKTAQNSASLHYLINSLNQTENESETFIEYKNKKWKELYSSQNTLNLKKQLITDIKAKLKTLSIPGFNREEFTDELINKIMKSSVLLVNNLSNKRAIARRNSGNGDEIIISSEHCNTQTLLNIAVQSLLQEEKYCVFCSEDMVKDLAFIIETQIYPEKISVEQILIVNNSYNFKIKRLTDSDTLPFVKSRQKHVIRKAFELSDSLLSEDKILSKILEKYPFNFSHKDIKSLADKTITDRLKTYLTEGVRTNNFDKAVKLIVLIFDSKKDIVIELFNEVFKNDSLKGVISSILTLKKKELINQMEYDIMNKYRDIAKLEEKLTEEFESKISLLHKKTPKNIITGALNSLTQAYNSRTAELNKRRKLLMYESENMDTDINAKLIFEKERVSELLASVKKSAVNVSRFRNNLSNALGFGFFKEYPGISLQKTAVMLYIFKNLNINIRTDSFIMQKKGKRYSFSDPSAVTQKDIDSARELMRYNKNKLILSDNNLIFIMDNIPYKNPDDLRNQTSEKPMKTEEYKYTAIKEPIKNSLSDKELEILLKYKKIIRKQLLQNLILSGDLKREFMKLTVSRNFQLKLDEMNKKLSVFMDGNLIITINVDLKNKIILDYNKYSNRFSTYLQLSDTCRTAA